MHEVQTCLASVSHVGCLFIIESDFLKVIQETSMLECHSPLLRHEYSPYLLTSPDPKSHLRPSTMIHQMMSCQVYSMSSMHEEVNDLSSIHE